MRDLLFKNLTSVHKKRRIIASSEVVDKGGIRSIIQRHFICMVREVKDNQFPRPRPSVYVLKEHNNRQQIERFSCRFKSSLFAVNNSRIFLITFMHSLKITLTASRQAAQ